MNIINNKFLDGVASGMEGLAELVRHVQPAEEPKTQEFHFSNISKENQKQYLDDLLDWEIRNNRDSSYIYVITAMDKVDLSVCNDAFTTAKNEKREGRAYARDNKVVSRTLYVGRSQSIKKRIAEHLGYGSKSTYALQMKYWATEIEGEFCIKIYRFEEPESNVIQAIEDGLWGKLKPMFGRQGAK